MTETTHVPDFGAYAFGLKSIREDVVANFGSSPELENHYAESVQWYVDCLAKDFPGSFNADEFKEAAGLQVVPPTCPECGKPVS